MIRLGLVKDLDAEYPTVDGYVWGDALFYDKLIRIRNHVYDTLSDSDIEDNCVVVCVECNSFLYTTLLIESMQSMQSCGRLGKILLFDSSCFIISLEDVRKIVQETLFKYNYAEIVVCMILTKGVLEHIFLSEIVNYCTREDIVLTLEYYDEQNVLVATQNFK